MKEQGKNPSDQTNEEEIGSLPEKEFRVMRVEMIQNLGTRMEKIQETFNKDLEELKSKQTMINNTINEIKNSPEGTTRGQTAEARKTTILQPVAQKPHSQKDRQDEKAEGYIPDEGTR